MNSETVSPETQMMKFILGKWISKPIHVAATLRIPDLLAEGSRKIDELSEMTETHCDSLYRMMRALAGVGIFAETKKHVFVNTPLSECLLEGRLRSAALMFHSKWHDRMWDNLMFSIRTGNPAFEKIYGEQAFDWFKKNPEEAEQFHEANSFKAAFSHRVIADVYDFTGISIITDVGGGLGGLMSEILKANSRMKGVVAELPETVRHLGQIIKRKNLEGRMTAVECDFFKKIPSGSDAYLLSHILHDWPDEKCLTILRNCRKAIGDRGKLLIAEAVITPGNDFSITKLLDLEVLLMGGGRERSEKEFRRLLKNSGFHLSRIIHTGDSLSVIEGIPE